MKRVSIKNKSKAALFIVVDSYIVDMHYVVSEQVHGCVHWVPIELHVHTHPFGVSHNQLKLVLLHFEVVQNVSVDLCNDEVSVVGQPLPILDGGEGRRTNHVGLRVGTNLLSDIDESCGTPKIIESKHYMYTCFRVQPIQDSPITLLQSHWHSFVSIIWNTCGVASTACQPLYPDPRSGLDIHDSTHTW